MKKLLALAVLGAAFAVATPASAQEARALCNEDSCAGIVKRCYYMTDYPTCIYPWPIVP